MGRSASISEQPFLASQEPDSRPLGETPSVVVAVFEEREIVRAGLVASLSLDPSLRVMTHDGEGLIDVAVVSSRTLRSREFACPVVVCCDGHERPRVLAELGDVAAVLQRESLTAAQLRATVHAAAAGLRLEIIGDEDPGGQLDPRSHRVLELVANGFGTREIAAEMNYSERTIKKLLTALQAHLGARNRAQAVAQAMRRGLL